MRDLNAKMFYKAKFTITAQDESVDILWCLVLEIRNWLLYKLNRDGRNVVVPSLRKWSRFKEGGKLFDETNSGLFYAESARHIDAEQSALVSWACRIVEMPAASDGYAPREWITEIGYQANEPGCATVTYVVTYSDVPGFIGLCAEEPSISLPRVIRALLGRTDIICRIGPDELRDDPIWLKPGDYPVFKRIVFNPKREVPVIFISPKWTPDEADRLLVSPSKLANSVAANAIVFCTSDTDFIEEMRYLEDPRYSCSGGAIRLYQPGVKPDDALDQYRHRFISASFIEEHGEACILEIFRRAIAQDVHFYDTMFRVKDCETLIEADRRKKRIEAIKAKSENDVNEALEEFLSESDKRLAAEQDAKCLNDKLSSAKASIYCLQSQIEALNSSISKARLIEQSLESVRAISVHPDTPEKIVSYFLAVFPERIVFTPRALKSLADCTTRSDFLWEALYYMVTDLYDLLHEQPATAYQTFTNKTGWSCSRGEGKMTHRDSGLKKQYVDDYDGHEINIEAHIKNGVKDSDSRSLRIYFAYDPQITDRIIVGHCGKHIDNYSTQKMK